jgi:hypothetical protein
MYGWEKKRVEGRVSRGERKVSSIECRGKEKRFYRFSRQFAFPLGTRHPTLAIVASNQYPVTRREGKE